jgi:hypothetical protein
MCLPPSDISQVLLNYDMSANESNAMDTNVGAAPPAAPKTGTSEVVLATPVKGQR